MTEYLVSPGTQTLEDGEEVSRTDEVAEALRESVRGRFVWWHPDGSFDYQPESDEDERLMILILDELDVLYARH